MRFCYTQSTSSVAGAKWDTFGFSCVYRGCLTGKGFRIAVDQDSEGLRLLSLLFRTGLWDVTSRSVCGSGVGVRKARARREAITTEILGSAKKRTPEKIV